MPSRRQFSGNASAQTLTADLTSVAATATISSATGWPNGAVGPFAVVIDRGTNVEEKCLCSGLSGNTLTFQTRGYDGTGGAAHSNGAAVELCLTAVDLDEANAHTSAVAGVHGISGNVVGTTDAQTLANKTHIQPTIADFTNATHDHTTNGQGGLIAGHHVATATASYTPSVGATVAHGAPFTPSFVSLTLPLSTNWLDYKIISIGATTVSFFLFVPGGAEAPTSSGTVTVLSVQ